MSAIGPKRTCASAPHMSAFGGKADIGRPGLNCLVSFSARSEAQPRGIKPNDHRDSNGNCRDADFIQVRSKQLWAPAKFGPRGRAGGMIRRGSVASEHPLDTAAREEEV